MTPQEKAKELYDKFKAVEIFGLCSEEPEVDAKQCALICVEEKYDGIINVIADLKGRGELTNEIFLKVLNDINKEREEVKAEVEKL